MRLIAHLVFLLLPFVSNAQFYKQSHADSLKRSLVNQTEQRRIQTLIHLSDCYHEIQLDSSLFYANKAKEESQEIDFDWGYYKSLYQIAKVEYKTTTIKEAEDKLKEIAKWFKENGFQKDALYAQLIYNYCISKNSSFAKTRGHLMSLFPVAETLNNNLLLGKLWYQLNLIEAGQLSGSKFQNSLDSSLYFYEKAKDSLGIFQVNLRKFRYRLGFEDAINFALLSQNRMKIWNNNRLFIELQVFLGLSYGVIHKIDSAYYFNQKALSLTSNYGSKDQLASIYFNMGYIHFINLEYKKAIIQFKKASELYFEIGNVFRYYNPTNYLANTYKRLGKYQQAINYSLEALRVSRSIEHSYYINSSMISLGELYHITNEFEKSENHYQKALKIAEENFTDRTKNKMVCKIKVSLAKLYMSIREYEKAIAQLNEAFAWYFKNDDSNALETAILRMAIYIDMEEYGLAVKMQNLSEELYKTKFKGNKEPYFYPYFFLQIGKLNFAQKQYAKSINALNTFLEKSSPTEINEEKRIANETLYKAYQNLGQYKKALQSHIEFKKVSDSINSSTTIENVALIQSKYELSEKEADLLKVKQEQQSQSLLVATQEAQLTHQKQNILLILLGVFLMVSLSLLLFNRYRLRKENKELAFKSKQLQLENQQKETNQQLKMAVLRSDFFTNVSHEFRTPLTLILGPLEKLLAKKNLENKQDIERIYRNATQLLSLVNETLELSKADSGHLPLAITSTTLGPYVVKVAQNFIPLSEIQQVNLEVIDNSQRCIVDVDENKLNKVLINLLSNAFKHTTGNGTVQLIIDAPKENSIIIQIKDNGTGIAAEHIPHIFNRFYQTDANTKGTGIGLALSKQLVELHGGTIRVESEIGVGSTFFIQIPLNQSNELIKSIFKEDHSITSITTNVINNKNDLRDKVVLIIEDNDDVRDYLKDLLNNSYDILLATNGKDGIELAEQNSPDLIVSDIMMPFKDGFELTKYLKKNITTSHIPIILLTAKASIDSKLTGLELGADDYLEKPFHAKELQQRCMNLIQQRIHLRNLFNSNYFISPRKLSTNKVDQDFLERAEIIVESHIGNPNLTIKQFCQELAHNHSGVHLKLKALTGKNASGFIRSIRIRNAAKLIKETNLNMNEIADKTGFGSRQAFNKAFKKHFLLTPTEFRDSDGFVPLA